MFISSSPICLRLLVLSALFGLLELTSANSAEYPNVIELVGYSNRRARTQFNQVDTQKPPRLAKIQADIETVKQNIEKYNKLLMVDTKNLPESQKDMLDRIVERVARLKESLDNGEHTMVTPYRVMRNNPAAELTSTGPTTDASTLAQDIETDPTLIIDETTMLQLQTAIDDLTSAEANATGETTQSRELPTTTAQYFGPDTVAVGIDAGTSETTDRASSLEAAAVTDFVQAKDAADDFEDELSLARSSNNTSFITAAASDEDTSSTPSTAGSMRTLPTSDKVTKTRATKRPSSSATKAGGASTTTVKRGQRPNKGPQRQTTAKQKVTTTTTTTTTMTPSSSDVIGNDVMYDAQVNTSSIIDSLNQAREEFYQQNKQSIGNKDKSPSSATAKPTKYHYYPHNQHIYLLPECAIQQVCNAVYVRLNYTQPLCACPSRYRDPCSASLNEDDQHTTKLVGDGKKKAITLAKTCEATTEMRECRSPKDWSLLALQNTRTGKSHYLVICRCPDYFKIEGPMAHDKPTYASVPGIRVFGMVCVEPGYAMRRPPVQPPKRYNLQKPYYRPQSQQTGFVNKNQYTNEFGYTYLNRSGTVPNYRPDTLPANDFPSGNIYGRNNERKGEAPVEAVTEDDGKVLISTSTQPTEEARTMLTEQENVESSKSEASIPIETGERNKRSLLEQDFDRDLPEFPWELALKFQQSIEWD